MEDLKLIRASLIAGLKEFGRPHDKRTIKKEVKRFKINLEEYKLYTYPGDELWWSWPEIIRDEFDPKDSEEYVAHTGDYSYIFDPFEETVLESGAEAITQELFKKFARKGKFYFYSADDNSMIGVLSKKTK